MQTGLLGFPQYPTQPVPPNAYVPGMVVSPDLSGVTSAPITTGTPAQVATVTSSPSFAHVSPEFAQYIPGIFAGESGGDYNALFGFSNRPGGQFSNVRLTDMTVGEALAFADPSGPYGQWVAGQVGRVATPMGAYQVVGTTLRAAMQGLGLTGNERMTPELQDRIGQWIYENQGIGAWEGFQAGVTELATPDPNARAPQGQGNMPQGLLSPTMSTMNAPEQRSQGLLAPLWDRLSGVPVLGRLADEETRLRLASGLAGLSTRPNQAVIDNSQSRLEEIATQERINLTVNWLNSIGRSDLAEAVAAGSLMGDQAAAIAMQPPEPPPAPIEINGQLVDPTTGQVIGDYRTAETPEAGYVSLTPEEVRAAGLPETGVWQRSPDGQLMQVDGSGRATSYIVTGEGAASLGLDPAFSYNIESGPEGMRATRIGGEGTNVTVNNAGEDAFSQETGKILAQEAATVVEQGATAQRNIGLIDSLASTLSANPTGGLAAFKLWAGERGINVDGLDDLQAAQAIINQLVPQQRPPGTGPMSDADLDLFKQSLPRIINTPGGNARIIATMRAIAEYDVARMDIARRLQLRQIDEEQAFREYAALGNPVADYAGTTAPTTGATRTYNPATGQLE